MYKTLCACGCGQWSWGLYKAGYRPKKALHHLEGYVSLYNPEHPNCHARAYVKRSILVAEKALGKYLPAGTVVHHIDEDTTNDKPNNPVICQDDSYHKLLHRRMAAHKNCGYANWRRCRYCKVYSPINQLYISPNGRQVYHRKCHAAYQYQLRMGAEICIADL